MPIPKTKTQKVQQSNGPLWKGPYEDGITQSLLNLFLMCRERFRVKVIDGLGATDKFKHAIEYGNMWHACEEALAKREDPLKALKDYANKLIRRYPLSQEEIEKWYLVCKMQFPIYVEYWRKHPDVKNREPLFQEEVFTVGYKLPSGRTVKMKGKFDSVDLIGKKPNQAIYLQENKTKGQIEEELLQKQLTFDMQTMFYIVALKLWLSLEGDAPVVFPGNRIPPIQGVRYNVVRRPFAGGKGMIRQKQATAKTKEETLPQLIERLRTDYIVPEPNYWFMRWQVVIGKTDTDRFCDEFLTPILEQLCDWWDSQVVSDGVKKSKLHYRTPYGIYNPLAEGLMTDVDEYIATGSTAGLQKLETLFPELEVL